MSCNSTHTGTLFAMAKFANLVDPVTQDFEVNTYTHTCTPTHKHIYTYMHAYMHACMYTLVGPVTQDFEEHTDMYAIYIHTYL